MKVSHPSPKESKFSSTGLLRRLFLGLLRAPFAGRHEGATRPREDACAPGMASLKHALQPGVQNPLPEPALQRKPIKQEETSASLSRNVS
jgi:hypothetical protein